MCRHHGVAVPRACGRGGGNTWRPLGDVPFAAVGATPSYSAQSGAGSRYSRSCHSWVGPADASEDSGHELGDTIMPPMAPLVQCGRSAGKATASCPDGAQEGLEVNPDVAPRSIRLGRAAGKRADGKQTPTGARCQHPSPGAARTPAEGASGGEKCKSSIS